MVSIRVYGFSPDQRPLSRGSLRHPSLPAIMRERKAVIIVAEFIWKVEIQAIVSIRKHVKINHTYFYERDAYEYRIYSF